MQVIGSRYLFIAITMLLLLGGCSNDDGGNSGPYSLTGVITPAIGNVTDSDVNDPLTIQVSNNNYTIAQSIPNPVVLGGYVNVAGAGSVGSLYVSGDRSDYYRVYLTAGQVVSLMIADSNPSANDLNLFLYEEPPIPPSDPNTISPLYSSTTTENTESIVLPSDPGVFSSGLYYVEVYANQGASNYVLSISQTVAAASQGTLDAEDDFVAGEMIVQFKDKVAKDPGVLANALGITLQASTPGSAVLMKLPENSVARRESLTALGVRQALIQGQSVTPLQQQKMETIQAIRALRQRDDVLLAEPNYLRYVAASPNDTLYSSQWHYPLINLPVAWDTTMGDAGVTVAVVDTGVLLNHPDLQGKLVTGYDFVSNVEYALDGNGIDSDPNDPGDRLSNSVNSSFHGTHVSGTIAATTDNLTGVAGVTWYTRVMPLRAMGKGGAGTSYDIMQAVRYAAGLSNDSGTVPSSIADVINLSLGGPSSSSYEQSVYDQVRAAGVVVVAAAGNESSSTASYPAAYSGVISVSAVDQNKLLAYYSNFGSTIMVTAPGGDLRYGTAGGIWSTLGDDLNYSPVQAAYYTYKAYQGTSMATPHVAGVVALMKSVYADLTPSDVDGLLACGLLTEDLLPSGRDNDFGYGLIDADKAVDAAIALAGGGSGCSLLQASPSQLNFGSSGQLLTLEVNNIGLGSPLIAGVTDDAAWLSVSATNVDPVTKLGTYSAYVDRAQLVADGIYRATIIFDYTTATLSVPVVVQKTSTPIDSDAGYLYITLIDANDFTGVQQLGREISGGQYSYSFAGVPAGQYYIVAGTDNNNDAEVCGPGESCGLYLTNNTFAPLQVSADLAGLNFEAGYDLYLTGPQWLQESQGFAINAVNKTKKVEIK